MALTFLCWQNTMSFKCLILSRRSAVSDRSSWDLDGNSVNVKLKHTLEESREGETLNSALETHGWVREVSEPEATSN